MCINKITPLQNEFQHYISTCTVHLITTRFQDDPRNTKACTLSAFSKIRATAGGSPMALGACLWFSPQLTFKSDHVQRTSVKLRFRHGSIHSVPIHKPIWQAGRPLELESCKKSSI